MILLPSSIDTAFLTTGGIEPLLEVVEPEEADTLLEEEDMIDPLNPNDNHQPNPIQLKKEPLIHLKGTMVVEAGAKPIAPPIPIPIQTINPKRHQINPLGLLLILRKLGVNNQDCQASKSLQNLKNQLQMTIMTTKLVTQLNHPLIPMPNTDLPQMNTDMTLMRIRRLMRIG